MAEGLNLATLNVAVQATGVQQTQSQVDNLTSSVQRSGSTTQQSAGSMMGAFNRLGDSVRGAFNNTQIFGTSLGDLRTQLSSGQGATALLQGAVTGLTTALINMAMQGLSKVISGLKDFVGKGIELASDLTEIQNVLDAAFGESAEEVNKWATTTASAYGLTELQAKQYSSTMGAIFSGMNITGEQAVTMSEQMAQLTGDMASFYNLDHDTAFNKIKSGLTGESEPLKVLGIMMNETTLSAYAMSQGIETAYSAMSESEKVILRYNYLINQTALAHEDFAKTQDSYSNVSKSMENNMDSLGATLGGTLLPSLTSVKVAMNDLLKTLSPITELIGKLVGGLLTMLFNSIRPIIDIVTTLIKVLNPVIEVLNDIIGKVIDFASKVGTQLATVVSTFTEKMGIIQDSTADTVAYTTETITEETNKALGYVDTAIDKWVNEQTDKYRAKLEERMGSDSLANAVYVEKMTQRYNQNLLDSTESVRKAHENAEASKRAAIEETTKALERQSKAQEEYTYSLKDLLTATLDIMSGGLTYGIRTSLKGAFSGNSYATGTAYHTGGLAMVGENGRELINLPRGTQVATNRQTENIMSGSGQVINNNNYYATIDAGNVRDFVDVTNAFSSYTQNARMGTV